MAENKLNHVFIRPADEHKDEASAESRFERERSEKMVAGMKSGEFEHAVKAYAGLNRVSNDFEQAVKTYAVFDRVSKNLRWDCSRV